MEVFSKFLALFIISGVVSAGDIFAEWLLSRKVRCPKCHRVMQRRPAWYHCVCCDSYVIFDFVAFWRHWNPEVPNAKNNSVDTVDQT